MFINKESRLRLLGLCLIIVLQLLLGKLTNINGQDRGVDRSSSIKPQEYAAKLQQMLIEQRKQQNINNQKPANTSSQTATATQDDNRNTHYRFVDNIGLDLEQGTDVGFTFWRLLPADTKDAANVVEKQRFSLRQKEMQIVPKRASSDTEFADGESLRFSVEVPIKSYIYLFDREQYLDGSYSEPYLIFPSRVDIGKTDCVLPNKLLFIPDESSYFTLERYIKDSPEKIAEVFTLLMSPNPVKELPPLANVQPRKIDKKLFEQLTSPGQYHTWRFEQERGIGLAITRAEKDADITKKEYLTEHDNLPQTIFHVAHKQDEPFAITVVARIRKLAK